MRARSNAEHEAVHPDHEALLTLLDDAPLRLPHTLAWALSSGGSNREAVRALERLVPEDRQRLETMATHLGNRVHHVAKIPRQARPLGLRVLFAPAYRRRTLLATLPWFLMDIGTDGVGLFTAVLLGAMHLGSGDPGLLARVQTLVEGSGLIDLFLLLGFLAGLWAVPRFGRIRIQMTGAVSRQPATHPGDDTCAWIFRTSLPAVACRLA